MTGHNPDPGGAGDMARMLCNALLFGYLIFIHPWVVSRQERRDANR